MPRLWRTIVLTTLPLIALLGGCYASVGPTIGYKAGEGFTVGAEIGGAGLLFAHGSSGVFVSQAKNEDGSRVATFYGSVGPGLYLPDQNGRLGGIVAAGIGMVADDRRGSEMSLSGGLWGGPSLTMGDRSAPFVFYCILGMRFWQDGVWFYLSPQLGIAYFPTINMD